ncbi:MAG TPA: hypothetical protein VK563_19405 [Puia sp.]|nr:hypothetical protein [Puia sp.]
MIAYNETSLDNKAVRDQAASALAANCISKEEYAQIGTAHPSAFYTPNLYIRIGLFLLTLVIATFSLGLLALMAMSSEYIIGALLIFSGLICYGVLEYLVFTKKHFRSGVDDALLWMSVVLLLAGIGVAVDNISNLSWSVMIFALALLTSLRFADRIMALIAWVALLAVFFYIVAESGRTGKLFISFLLMAVSVAGYFLVTFLHQDKRYRHYRSSLELVRAASLISFYLAGNYLVVREMSVLLLHAPLRDVQGIPLGWLFWMLTVATPLFYIYRGVRKKDAIFLWVGLVLIAATVYTIRHYYPVMPLELAMVAGGIVLVVLAWGLIRYLRTPRHGFTGEATDDSHFLESLHLETLVIAETFRPVAPPPDDFRFGGGSGGGGGAGGQY